MFKNMGLQTRLISGFVLVGCLVLIVGLIGVIGTSRLSGHIDNLGNNVVPSLVGLWTSNEAQSRELAAEKSLIISSLTAEQRKEQLKRLDQAAKDIEKGIAQYDRAFRYPEEQKIYDRVKNELNNWKQAREEFLNLHDQYLKTGITNPRQAMLDLVQQGKNNTPEFAAAKVGADALTLMNQFGDAKLEPASDAITNALAELLAYNTKVGDDATKQAFQDAAASSVFILICLFVGPTIAVIFGIYFSNTIVKPLGAKIAGVVSVAEKVSSGDLTTQVPVSEDRDEVGRLTLAFRGMTDNLNSLIRQVQQSGIQITTSATQIAASGKELEATMTEQAASTNRVATTAKTIVSTSKKLLKTIDEVEHTSKETADSASDSQKDLSQMETTMRRLAEATSSISGRLGVISDKANNINSIVTTITKVADQTNLLSLNAAIEAEKAGEYGSGFAVVAREIRRLADQTAVASLDIENMVKEMQAAVSLGVMEMDKFTNEVEQGVNKVHEIGIKLESIIDQVQTLTPRFQEVGNSMEGQSQEAEQISESMIQLSEASAQTAQSLREINGAISQLNDAAQNLRQEISRFKIAKS